MKFPKLNRRLLLSTIVLAVLTAGGNAEAQTRRGRAGKRVPAAARVAANQTPEVLERNVRAHMEFLASDAMQGRGSGTQFELLAGHYIASQLRQYGVEPAGDETRTRDARIVKESTRRGSNPQPPAWEADALPLSYSCIKSLT